MGFQKTLLAAQNCQIVGIIQNDIHYFLQGQTLKWHHFRQNSQIYDFYVYHRVVCMPDIVVWRKSTLDITLCVNAGMDAINFVQGQTIN